MGDGEWRSMLLEALRAASGAVPKQIKTTISIWQPFSNSYLSFSFLTFFNSQIPLMQQDPSSDSAAVQHQKMNFNGQRDTSSIDEQQSKEQLEESSSLGSRSSMKIQSNPLKDSAPLTRPLPSLKSADEANTGPSSASPTYGLQSDSASAGCHLNHEKQSPDAICDLPSTAQQKTLFKCSQGEFQDVWYIFKRFESLALLNLHHYQHELAELEKDVINDNEEPGGCFRDSSQRKRLRKLLKDYRKYLVLILGRLDG